MPAITHRADSRGWTSLQTSGGEGRERPTAIIFSARTSVQGWNTAVDQRWGGWWVERNPRRSGGGRGMAAAILSSADESVQTACWVCRHGEATGVRENGSGKGEEKRDGRCQGGVPQDGQGGRRPPRTRPIGWPRGAVVTENMW